MHFQQYARQARVSQAAAGGSSEERALAVSCPVFTCLQQADDPCVNGYAWGSPKPQIGLPHARRIAAGPPPQAGKLGSPLTPEQKVAEIPDVTFRSAGFQQRMRDITGNEPAQRAYVRKLFASRGVTWEPERAAAPQPDPLEHAEARLTSADYSAQRQKRNTEYAPPQPEEPAPKLREEFLHYRKDDGEQATLPAPQQATRPAPQETKWAPAAETYQAAEAAKPLSADRRCSPCELGADGRCTSCALGVADAITIMARRHGMEATITTLKALTATLEK